MTRFASLACVLVLMLGLCGIMVAQAPILDVYQVTYYDNNFGEGAYFDAGTIRIINPGVTGSPISGDQGTLCANIYVFDDTQEMVECCSCPVTANGLLTLSVQDLTENPLMVTPFRGVIKVVSTAPSPTCDPTNLTVPTADLRAFSTHLQNASFGGTNNTRAGSYFITEDEFAAAPLSAVEQGDLATICSMMRYLGSGRARCDDECDEPIGGD